MDNNVYLNDLDYLILKKLGNALSVNKNWFSVINLLGIFSQTTITEIEQSEKPGNMLLNELIIKCCPLSGLKLILEECKLYDILEIIADPEPLKIIQQINDGKEDPIYVNFEKDLELNFIVRGFPLPTYSWIKDNIPVTPEQNTMKLCIKKFGKNDEGEYWCEARQTLHDGSVHIINSKCVDVRITPIQCKIIEQPKEEIFHRKGSPLILSCKAVGYPGPFYSWYHYNQDLNAHQNVFEITDPDETCNGEYYCFITNKIDEVYTRVSTVKILQQIKPLKSKLALLIANEDYHNFELLKTPANDICTLAEKLTSMNFEIVPVINLTYLEMMLLFDRFSLLIEENMYVFIYFSGHGFEYNKNKYLVPIDSPDMNDNILKHSICEDVILNLILKKKPKLVISVLDMCLKLVNSSNEINTKQISIPKCLSNKNLIQAYSTSSSRSSYESDIRFNGFYMNSLKDFITKSISVTNVFIETHKKLDADIGDTLEQIPCLSLDIADDFFFNDPVTDDFSHRNFIKKLKFNHNITFNFTPYGEVKGQLSCYQNVFINALQLTVDKNTPLTCELLTHNVKLNLAIDDEKKYFIFTNLQKTSNMLDVVLCYNNNKKKRWSLQDINVLWL